MASYFSTANGNFRLVFDISVASQNRNTNTSYVNFALRLQTTNLSQALISSSGDRFWVNFNGTNWIDKTYSWSISGAHSVSTIAHVENVPVVHGPNGKKTVKIYFDKEQGSGPNPPGRLHGECSFTLPNIARQSKPTLNKSSVTMGQAVTINTNRLDSSYTHTITYKMGSASGTIATNVGASYSWTVPTSLASQIQSVSSGTVEITVTTKYGNETLGSEKVNLTVNVPAGNPNISSIQFSDVMSGKPSALNSIYIQNKSLIKVVVNASAQYGATIKSYEISAVGVKRTSQTSTFPALNTSGLVQFSTTVTDSRNRKTTVNQNLTLEPYKSPIIKSFKASRVNAQGEDDEDGAKAKIQYGYEISSINNKNTVDVKVIRTGTTGNLVSIQSPNSDYLKVNQSYLDMTNDYLSDSSYELVFTVKDCFTQTVQKVRIDPCYSLIDWGPNGKSIAFGMMSSNNGKFEIGSDMEMTTNASNALRMKRGDYSSIFRQDGSDFWYLLTNQNDPNGGYNSLRPLRIQNSTGAVHIGTSLSMTSGAPLYDRNGTDVRGRPSLYINDQSLTVGGFLQLLYNNYQLCVRNLINFHIKVPAGWSPTGTAAWGSGFFNFQNAPGSSSTPNGGGVFIGMTGVPYTFYITQGSTSAPYTNATIQWRGIVGTNLASMKIRTGRVQIASDTGGNFTYFTNARCNTLLGVSNSTASNTILLATIDGVGNANPPYYQGDNNPPRWVIHSGAVSSTKYVNYVLIYWG